MGQDILRIAAFKKVELRSTRYRAKKGALATSKSRPDECSFWRPTDRSFRTLFEPYYFLTLYPTYYPPQHPSATGPLYCDYSHISPLPSYPHLLMFNIVIKMRTPPKNPFTAKFTICCSIYHRRTTHTEFHRSSLVLPSWIQTMTLQFNNYAIQPFYTACRAYFEISTCRDIELIIQRPEYDPASQVVEQY